MVQTTLKVNGMMCGMCESHINDVVRKTVQVEKVTLPTPRARRSSSRPSRWTSKP